tara:strand:+ start:215 stop:517 length:303 start_codon:yes stop_codon:yes gene_type:complete
MNIFIWFVYLMASLFISFVLAQAINKKYSIYFTVLFFSFFVTPSAIGVREGVLSPAVFVFFYDALFEIGLSFSTLRPLLLALPISLFLTYIIIYFKRKFF